MFRPKFSPAETTPPGEGWETGGAVSDAGTYLRGLAWRAMEVKQKEKGKGKGKA